MIAILGGLGAAICWATATLTSSRSSRIIGSSSTVAWMMLVGVVVATPLALASGPLPPITPSLAFWMAASGIGGVVGLLFVYRGLSIGKVGVVSAVTSTEGAIAAVLSVATGESLTVPVAVMLGVIAVGVAMVALAASEPSAAAPSAAAGPSSQLLHLHAERQAVVLAVAAALCFGISIFASAQAGRVLSPFAAVLPVRLVGFVGVFVPMALAGRLRLTRQTVPMVILIGFAEVLGNASYIAGGQESIAVAAVLASQFAAIAAVVAFLLFHERLTRHQRNGVIAIVAGVAMLTLFRG